VPFTVQPAGVEELTAGEPQAVAVENARRKALALAHDGLVLGADTLVTVDGEILGKPRDAAQAIEYVGRLAGRSPAAAR
jgi:septum formation protein